MTQVIQQNTTTIMEDVEKVKEDFADTVVRENPELMKSMHEMFES